MEISCPSFLSNSGSGIWESVSDEDDGGYGSHDTSQDVEIVAFCFRKWEGLKYPLITAAGNTLTLTQDPSIDFDPDLKDYVLATLEGKVLDVAIFNQLLIVALTEDGVFGVNTREASQFARGQLLLGGNFRGLAVLGADSECPLILTTYTNNDVSFLYVIDISGDVHCQKMPLSTIPSDMLPFSLITSIAVDDNTNDIFLCDGGLQKVFKVNLIDYSCNLFCTFPQTMEVIGCLSTPSKVLVVVKRNDNIHFCSINPKISSVNPRMPPISSQQILVGRKLKIGFLGTEAALLIDGKIEKFNPDVYC